MFLLKKTIKKKKVKVPELFLPYRYFNFLSENLLRVEEQFGYLNFSLYLVIFRGNNKKSTLYE